MGFVVGMKPGRVYEPAELLQGKCPGLGTFGDAVGNTSGGGDLTNIAARVGGGDCRTYVLVQVGAGLHLVNGTVVQYQGNFLATLPGSAGAGIPNIGPLAVIVASITASASQLVWAQVAGLCNVLVEATASAIPGAAVKLGGTSGQVTAVAVTTASNYITGMVIMATVSAVGLGAVMLNYPRVISG